MKRYINKTIILPVILLAGFSGLAKAQDKMQAINLETVLKLGGANNLTIQEYKQRQKLALANLAKANEWWLPDIFTGTIIHQLWGNAMNTDGRIFTSLNRQSFWGGTGLSATLDFGDGIFKANAAKLKAKASAYQTQAEKNKALLKIIETYYDFLEVQLNYEAYEQLVAEADDLASQIAIQVEAGLRFESELLLAKSNSNHVRVEMLNARTQYYSMSATLVKLLNLDPFMKLVGTETVLAPIELITTQSKDVSFDSAYQSRPELKSMELMLQSLYEEKKTTTIGLWLPELSVNTKGSYFGDILNPLDPTAEINGALLWKIPLGRLTFGGELKQHNARIALHKIQMEQTRAQVNEEVISAREQILAAKEQIKVALEGSQLGEQALKQSIQRQQFGTVRPFEILQAMEIYIKSRLDHLKAVSTYNKAQYKLLVAMGNDL
ncbi:MAG: TolC family protein [Candidatus Scalinduaceae bacterium]